MESPYLDKVIAAGTCRKLKGHENGPNKGYQMQQSPRELARLCEHIEALGIRSYLEVGLRTGGTWKFLSDLFKFNPSCGITLDKSQILWYPSASAAMCFADSRLPETVDWADQYGPFDLVFVDGSHKMEDVLDDWQNYRLCARYMAFHDTKLGTGVERAWRAISAVDKVLDHFVDSEVPFGTGLIEVVDGASRLRSSAS